MIAFNCCDGKAGAAQVTDEWVGFIPFNASVHHIYRNLAVAQEYFLNGALHSTAAYTFRDGDCNPTEISGTGGTNEMTGPEFICYIVENFRTIMPPPTITIVLGPDGLTARSVWTALYPSFPPQTSYQVVTDFTLSDPIPVDMLTMIEETCQRVDQIWPGGGDMRDYQDRRINGTSQGVVSTAFQGWFAHRYICDAEETIARYGGSGLFACFSECRSTQETCILKARKITLVCRKFSTVGLPVAGFTWRGLQIAAGSPAYGPRPPCVLTCGSPGHDTCTCEPNFQGPGPYFSGDCLLSAIVEAHALNTQITPKLELA